MYFIVHKKVEYNLTSTIAGTDSMSEIGWRARTDRNASVSIPYLTNPIPKLVRLTENLMSFIEIILTITIAIYKNTDLELHNILLQFLKPYLSLLVGKIIMARALLAAALWKDFVKLRLQLHNKET